MTKDQLITEKYAIYNSDCMEVLPTISDHSIDLVIYSPPFAGLYNYSSDERDFSNCESKEQFMQQYEFLIAELARVTKPGRINAVHCQDIITHTTKHNLWDFPHEIIKLHLKYGFTYNNRVTIWKEPLEVRMRTMVQSLMHKNIVEDSTRCFAAVPDYLLIFRKGGENKVPVTHEKGLKMYFGKTPMLPEMEEKYGKFEHLEIKYKNHDDPKTNKLSHVIWQRYASSVWDDIDGKNVLPFRDAREEDDEKHVHPLQLDVIDRIVELYSNPGEVVLTPFAGVGSEVYSPVSLGRKAIGIELKDSYYKQMIENMKLTSERFGEKNQLKMFE
ncbi:MAG: site-specific DNA-methyltransferase [Candidatus Moranbacteria bacterium]|nr:site-specific DNA-methyltransferase [Candidatus Moranbacteria bacterium]